jgi:hypothetical protein
VTERKQNAEAEHRGPGIVYKRPGLEHIQWGTGHEHMPVQPRRSGNQDFDCSSFLLNKICKKSKFLNKHE